jgi:hypothetical protein
VIFPNIKFYENLFSSSGAGLAWAYMQTEGRTERFNIRKAVLRASSKKEYKCEI